MNFDQRYRNSKILFGFSLLLLVGFLSIWLQNVYQNKVEELENKVSYLWISAFKDIESKDFTNLIVASFSASLDSMEFDSSDLPPSGLNLQSIFQKRILDSSQNKHFKTHYSFKSVGKHQEVKIILDGDSSLLPNTTAKGLMFFDSSEIEIETRNDLDVEEDIFVDSSDKLHGKVINQFSKVIERFAIDVSLVGVILDSSLHQEKIPIEYEIILLKDNEEETNPHQHHGDKFYTRTATGAKYTLEMSNYSNYVIQNMWLEFLMGCFLFFTIAAAFYYMLHNLKEQHRLVTIKNDLISNITHELRTPIFTVSAALEALENFNGLANPERTKEYLNISKNELNRLSILVEKVLKTSLFEQSVMKINKETFQLNSLVETIANSLKLQLENQAATLYIDASKEGIELFADKIHITNVIYNLLDNALKYSSNRPPVIHLKIQDLDDSIQIQISDNGIGIPAEYLNQIFTKFFRVPKGNQHNVKGYGLGLNYVSNMIKQHEGSIVATSQEGLGTTFTITLPKFTTT